MVQKSRCSELAGPKKKEEKPPFSTPGCKGATVMTTKISEQFNCIPGTNREKLLLALLGTPKPALLKFRQGEAAALPQAVAPVATE